MDRRLEVERPARRTLSALVALALAASLLVVWADTARADTFTVENARDQGAGSLRNAINRANNQAGPDKIRFRIRGAGVQSINLASPLPEISGAVTINGYTQPGASANTLATGNDAVLKVQLNGANAGTGPDANGLVIATDDSTIKGLVINRFDSRGIVVDGFDTTGNRIEGNFIGTNAAGTGALGNEDGVDIQRADDTTVGGTAPAARNVISGNRDAGIQIVGDFATNNEVLGNFIGTDRNGTADLGNAGEGIHISDARNNKIGGTPGGARNVISGNNQHGIQIQTLFENPTGNNVEGNFIGTSASGAASLGNGLAGVQVAGADDNTVGGTVSGAGNRIAHNGAAGVSVIVNGAFGDEGATGNRILSNSIFANAGLGIDLGASGVAANDNDDPDTGANDLQNFPVITSATRSTSSGLTTITGTLNSNPSRNFIVQCFVAAPDPSGFGEGQIPAGTDTSVTTNASGDASFSCVSPIAQTGQTVTATATSQRQFIGDTSEFSQILGVAAVP